MLVEFIIPTYNRVEPLRAMLASLKAQTDLDWHATVIQDGTETEDSFKVVASLFDSRISCFATEKRYNDWGHSLRELGKNRSVADYVIMTGDDNYYTPNFVAELREAAKLNPGLIYWDMVHSHYDYQYFECRPAFNQIDMGAFATRNDLAKQIKLNTSYAADGEFVRDFNIKFPKEQKIKINKCLFVHN
jgi:GT2 family glycosyltransferase